MDVICRKAWLLWGEAWYILRSANHSPCANVSETYLMPPLSTFTLTMQVFIFFALSRIFMVLDWCWNFIESQNSNKTDSNASTLFWRSDNQSQMLYFIAQTSWCILIIAMLNKIVNFFQVFSESLDKIVK